MKLERRFVAIYDEQAERGYDYFEFDNQYQFKERVYGVAQWWSNINFKADYEEFLYQKYGANYPDTEFEEEKKDFNAFLENQMEEKYGYTYLEDCGFSVYEITEDFYNKIFEESKEFFNFDPSKPYVVGKLSSDGTLLQKKRNSL